MSEPTGRDLSPRRSEPVIMTEIVFPQDTNHYGTMFGGNAYAMMDKAAFLAANRFSGTMAVTAATERIEFTTPIKHGMIIDIVARVIHAGRTSMIVEAELFCQDPLIGDRQLATNGYFTMVSIGADGKPVQIPELIVETDEEREKWAIGEEIRQAASARRQARRNEA